MLLPCDRGAVSDEKAFAGFGLEVKRALKGLAYTEMPSIDEADIAVLLSYGLGEPGAACVPVTRPAAGLPYALVAARGTGRSGLAPRGTLSGGTVYRRYLMLLAVESGPYRAGKVVPVWKAVAESRGYLSNMEVIFPALLASVTPFIGRTTEDDVVFHMMPEGEGSRAIPGKVRQTDTYDSDREKERERPTPPVSR